MKKIISILSVVFLFAGMLIAGTNSAKAAVVVTGGAGGTGDGVTTFGIDAGTAGGAWTNLTPIVITEGAVGDIAVGAGATLILTAPTGFEFNTVAPPDAVKTGADITAITSPVGAAATTLTLTFTAGAAATSDTITIGGVTPIGIRPTAVNLPAGNITRKTGSAGTAVIAGITLDVTNFGTAREVPAAVANLSCVASGSGGAVYLRWTDGAGDAKTGYDVRYSLANITGANYANATAFAQTWAGGVNTTPEQQLVTSLTPNNVYFFALKSNSANGLGAVSNTVNCNAPSGYTAPSDTTAPTSIIISPTASQGIKAGAPFTISGTASDTGGSSVQKVEVSLDGGTTWNAAVAVSNAAGVLSWQYIWSNPIVGSYTVKARAYDWLGNREISAAGVAVVVLVNPPSFTIEIGAPTPTPTPTPTPLPGPATPASPSGVTLYRAEGDNRVYVIKEGKKEWVKTEADFNAAGYKWTDVVVTTPAAVASYPDAAAIEAKVKVTGTSTLRVRKSNTALSAILGYVKKNEIFTALEEKPGWYKIQTSSGIIGWISGAYAAKQ